MIGRALAALALVPAAASAEPAPDPAVADAADANLASRAPRDNIVLTVGAGPSFTLGFGIEDAVGRGGSGTLRLAKVATRRTLVTLEVSTYALLHSFAGQRYTNTAATLSVGAQYYARPKLWLRLATGAGFYRGRMVMLETGGRGDQRLSGLAGTAGVGLDLTRWGRVVLGVEVASTLVATRDGVLASNGLLLGLAID